MGTSERIGEYMSKTPSKLPPISVKQLAQLAGLSANHLAKLAAAGHVPKPVRGQFADTGAAIAALLKYYRLGRESSSEIAQAKLRHVDAQTEDVRQRTAIRGGKVAPMDEVTTVFDATLNIFAASMDGLGGRLCNELAPEPSPAIIKGKIDDETRRILQTASASLSAYAHDRGGRQVAAASGRPQRRRMGR